MTEVVNEFVTPDRVSHQGKNSGQGEHGDAKATKSASHKAATVTPAESSRDDVKGQAEKGPLSAVEMIAEHQIDSPEDRKVRFEKGERNSSISDSPLSTDSQRGLVSRRGGRISSPGRVIKSSPKKENILEFKTVASPREETIDSIPSLRSDGSSGRIKESAESSSGSDKQNIGEHKPRSGDKKSSVTFSPVPPPRTPLRSPTGRRFQSLPELDNETLRSPGSFFLSPNTPTPASKLKNSDSFEQNEADSKDVAKISAQHSYLSPKTPRSPRTPRKDEKDRFLTTPTNFATDYGKHTNSDSFDQSNVLSWLQSPTANGLFSPGFASMLNTPKVVPQTPRTPTVSTSFFFSDVAGLPGSSETSPKLERKKSGSRGMSNIICISPLASSKAKPGNNAAYTPTINYKDMFASPEKGRLLMLPDSPLKMSKSRGQRSGKDPSIDAVHMAERELMEDEDLSALLHLASSTPKANGERPVAVSTSEGTHVFRSSPKQKSMRNGTLPSLQLPIIGDKEGDSNATRLSRKTHSRDHGDRPLDVSSTSETKSREGKARDNVKPDIEKSSRMGNLHHSHSAHPGYTPQHHYAHPDVAYYPHMQQHTGSMRVVVGGPPRNKGSPPRSPHVRYPMGPGDPNYPSGAYPPLGHYPHHHGVPPPHLHHYYAPPPHHGQRHMPIYTAQHATGKAKSGKKPAPSSNQKRPLLPHVPAKLGSTKKQKRATPGTGKKKNRSPQLIDKAERQKAAANIKAVNEASGGKNDKAAQLAAAILRGVTMRPSGKWQAQLYFAGKSRYIGVFDTREKAALAYEIAREKLKSEKQNAEGGQLTPKATEDAVNAARKAAFEGVNEKDPRLS